eukprot:CAMPEP_0114581354 /NCGR_PEP_ID=MMETSP0125-20121206/5469_1 /TAXON_ID=485358 ORGANISM="Aristerostoma sp., Strain ATCC 50986" /NCGR_SAMPLE_ID=MMETSP0125 /ASSEMBLY_ACC=CAM_ASM_000245 /LENGTH=74 /DNA_ID=CAMNT_0001773491 /DNA_START=2839 /DNA_END=3063 /DNA_ORIENTATION=+
MDAEQKKINDLNEVLDLSDDGNGDVEEGEEKAKAEGEAEKKEEIVEESAQKNEMEGEEKAKEEGDAEKKVEEDK